MNQEMILTERDLRGQFQGERDLVTYSLYRVGDHVVRCNHCRAIVKTEFTANGCPLCGAAPFVRAPVAVSNSAVSSTEDTVRKFFYLLLISVVAAMIPAMIPSVQAYIIHVSHTNQDFVLFITCAISLLTAFMVYKSSDARAAWQAGRGKWLVALPALMPYLVLLTFLIGLVLLEIVKFLAILILILGFFIAIIGG